MSSLDIRWHQRLDNYLKALARLQEAVTICQSREVSDLEKYGLIQCFEFVHELSWNVMKDYFEYQGNNSITGSRDATRESFQKGLITEGDLWMEMIKSRNKSSHTYDEAILIHLVSRICEVYYQLFQDFADKIVTLKSL